MFTLDLRNEVEKVKEDIITFAQPLVQTPSITGKEQAVAESITAKIGKLGYDQVFTDPIGNVTGVIEGSGEGKNIMFNGHMDHVDIGRLESWPYDPFSGTIEEDYLYGRGTCDMKCSLASQIYSAALIKKLGIEHKGDIIVTCVIQEELGMRLGIGYLCDVTFPKRGIHVDTVVIGEPSNLKLILGHKGRVEIEINTYGRASHASAPWLGINAVYKMLPIILKIQKLDQSFIGNQLTLRYVIGRRLISE